jgi:hypothetical protein
MNTATAGLAERIAPPPASVAGVQLDEMMANLQKKLEMLKKMEESEKSSFQTRMAKLQSEVVASHGALQHLQILKRQLAAGKRA